ncbi:MAG: ribokinase, partial [Planctomycetes bacterium]|nr:ribokinase [Planctomycetota bacterium]
MASRIAVVGSSNTDMIVKVPKIPRPGETVIGGTFSTAAGGKGANQAVAAARAGGDVTLVARVGADMFGDQALQGFIEDGIHVEHVLRDPDAPSGVALIFVGESGENSIAVAPGANAHLTPRDVEKASGAIRGADILVVQLETTMESVQTACAIAAEAGVRVILNPAPAQPIPDELLSRVSILTPNESEAELLAGVRVEDAGSAERAARKLLERGPQVVIVTLGASGSLVATAEGTELVESFRVEPVDTTAAGDVFNGSLAVALAEGQPLRAAVRFASAAAAISVTRLGAQPSAPLR